MGAVRAVGLSRGLGREPLPSFLEQSWKEEQGPQRDEGIPCPGIGSWQEGEAGISASH